MIILTLILFGVVEGLSPGTGQSARLLEQLFPFLLGYIVIIGLFGICNFLIKRKIKKMRMQSVQKTIGNIKEYREEKKKYKEIKGKTKEYGKKKK